MYWRSRDAVHSVRPQLYVVECASPGEISGVIPVKDTPTSCGSAPALDDDSPISGDDGRVLRYR